MEFHEYLLNQMKRHPSMQPQDIVKLCYQAAFGADHLLTDKEAAYQYFQSEFFSVDSASIPLYEEISPHFCRINLAAWKKLNLPPQWLFQMFACSASSPHGSEELFDRYIEIAHSLIESGNITASVTEWANFRKHYESCGIRPLHHSQLYRDHERPAYRVILSSFIRLLPLLVKLSALPEKNTARIVAIDGPSASGKTTIAAQLEKILEAGIIHMDDFFLPQDLRTNNRLAQPGGNVHYERFIEEVLPSLSSMEAFSYRKFDCSLMRFNGKREVPKAKWRIVEGAYSCHPEFGNYMDLRVFLEIDAVEQHRRIHARNGEEMARLFAERWIPMEEAYFQQYHIREKSHLVL